MNEREESKQGGGQAGVLFLVRKPVQKAKPAIEELRASAGAVREATTGRVVAMLPRVWAVAAPAAVDSEGQPKAAAQKPPVPELAFYRKYTEAMLRRYMRLSTEAGRVPSLLGRELFRGQVTSYRVKSFEDVVIFCHDVEKCLDKLQPLERRLIKRIALQQYTHAETAAILGISHRGCQQKYWLTLDRLTEVFLRLKLMDAISGCQEGRGGSIPSSE
jgi:hypothetical protein